jgi:N6-L-threonylcarbamoyladenine synthase
LVGLSTGKALALARGIPVVGVHHIEGHILAPLLETEIDFPFLALAVSGGHTHLYRVDGIGAYTTVGRTLDDAAGEAFDKVPKLLGLGYPGGALIDALAAKGDAGAIRFPRPLLHKPNLDFSFSGIKTAVLNHVKGLQQELTQPLLQDIAAGFQAAVVEVLCAKTLRAAEQFNLSRIVVAGGVACNRGLRTRFAELAARQGYQIYFPSPALCGDNAAMLGVAGDYYLSRGISSGTELNAVSSWPLDQVGCC